MVTYDQVTATCGLGWWFEVDGKLIKPRLKLHGAWKPLITGLMVLEFRGITQPIMLLTGLMQLTHQQALLVLSYRKSCIGPRLKTPHMLVFLRNSCAPPGTTPTPRPRSHPPEVLGCIGVPLP